MARAGRRLGAPALAADGAVWWSEGRPSEGGRVVLVRRAAGGEPERHPGRDQRAHPRARVRRRLLDAGRRPTASLFVEFADQRLYRQRLGEEPVAITPEPRAAGGAALRRHAARRRTARRVVCVRERHGEGEAVNEIVVAAARRLGRAARCSPAGRDFYSFPRLSPDGARLAWTCWDHPNMPWDGTELWLAPLDRPAARRGCSPAAPAESIFQPEWDADGRLHFVSDRDGWWNLYRAGDGSGEEDAGQLTAEEAELGHPQWLFGGSTYAFLAERRDRCVRSDGRRGTARPARARGRASRATSACPSPPSASRRSRPRRRGRLRRRQPGERDGDRRLRRRPAARPRCSARPATSRSTRPTSRGPRAIEFPTAGGETAHAFYYPPTNPDFAAPEGELPPLIVAEPRRPDRPRHPRARPRVPLLDQPRLRRRRRQLPRLQRLRPRLPRRACTAPGASSTPRTASPRRRYLAEQGEADGGAAGDPRRLGRRLHDPLRARLPRRLRRRRQLLRRRRPEALARDTHKFESRYLDGLIGPYPERADLYRERSPIHHVERLRAPVILFQGLEDEVVPPNQAETMVAALARNGVPHAYLAFEGEQHGFRKAETEIRCLEAELYFYGRILGFEPAEDLEPVEIDGLS